MQTSRQSERQELGERAASQVHVMLQQYNAHFSCVCIPSKRAREPELILAQGTTIANMDGIVPRWWGKSLIKCIISYQCIIDVFHSMSYVQRCLPGLCCKWAS